MKDEFSGYYSIKNLDINQNRRIIDENYIFKRLKDYQIIKENHNGYDFIDSEFFNKENQSVIKNLINEIIKVNFSDKISIFIPGNDFVSLSVTGKECDLHCEHCDVKYLHSMKDVSDEYKLKYQLNKLISSNAQGCLISGGCDSDGKVPLLKYIKILKDYHKYSDLIFNFHTGLLREYEVEQLATIPPDVVSFDFTIDEEIIRNIYHLNDRSIEDYKDTLNFFLKYNLNVIPHITIGLNFGNVKKEIEALKYLKSLNKDFDLIVFIILIPPKNNEMFKTVDLENISKVFRAARLIFPRTELSIGCMRPRGKIYSEIEKKAIDGGINRLVIPSRNAKKYIAEKGYITQDFNACCAIPLNLYKKNKINKKK